MLTIPPPSAHIDNIEPKINEMYYKGIRVFNDIEETAMVHQTSTR